MKARNLQMFLSEGELLFDLHWQDGVLTTVFAKATMLPAIERWKAGGVRELVPLPDGTREPRMTPVTDAEFLPNLASCLQRQFGFLPVLTEV
jgi:hypothetical protein